MSELLRYSTMLVDGTKLPVTPHVRWRDVMQIRILAGMIALAAWGHLELTTPVSVQNGRLQDLRWMAGCLEMRSGDRLVEEHRMDVRGGSMLGMARTTTGSALGEYELTLIREKDGKVVFEAHPSGQPPAVFTARVVGVDSAVFTAPEHDYPQIVGYRRSGPDSVVAWIDGTAGGKSRRVEFPYRRVRCPGQGGGSA
ncbi:MAG TPA: DUF6265 family protein [Gemmatimonadales bacterium]|nr:DUF6265 family protein [Gemmatimonadales bacterium]